MSASALSEPNDKLAFLARALDRLEHKIDRLSNTVEELRSRSGRQLWWEYARLKDERSGYPGVSILMALGKYKKFDRTVQWMKTARVAKSTFYKVLRDLKAMGLINRWKELTVLGERAFGYIETSSVPIITKTRLQEVVEQLRAKHQL